MHSILIIEDDEDYRELLELGLNDLGYQVTPSSNAKNGLALLNEYKFDLIISDILMPEMDGLEFLLEVKKTTNDAKIIMISGGGAKKNKLYLDNSSAMGCDAVLDKPFTIRELEKSIQSVL